MDNQHARRNQKEYSKVGLTIMGVEGYYKDDETGIFVKDKEEKYRFTFMDEHKYRVKRETSNMAMVPTTLYSDLVEGLPIDKNKEWFFKVKIKTSKHGFDHVLVGKNTINEKRVTETISNNGLLPF